MRKGKPTLSKGSARQQFDVALALVSAIPVLAFSLLIYQWTNEVTSFSYYVVFIVAVLLLMSAGYMLLLRYPRNIFRLRRYLEDMVQGEMPEKIDLLRTENDIGAIEDSMNWILKKLKQDLSRITAENQMLEHKLAQAQKLESMGMLSAGIAHEINTPVQYITDNTRFMQKSFKDMLTLINSYGSIVDQLVAAPGQDEMRKQVEQARSQCDLTFILEELPPALEDSLGGLRNVARIVSAMKDFSYLGRYDEVESADINTAVQSTVTVSRNEWKYVAKLDMDLELGLPEINCYVGDVKQALLNLIVNAAHAVEARREADQTTELGMLCVRTRYDDEWVYIDVEDDGGGIPEVVQPKLFEPFFTTKPSGKGTGQGLPIARTVIEKKNHGKLTYRTELGHGTVFTVWLPRGGVPLGEDAS